jgi:hypothetical protein
MIPDWTANLPGSYYGFCNDHGRYDFTRSEYDKQCPRCGLVASLHRRLHPPCVTDNSNVEGFRRTAALKKFEFGWGRSGLRRVSWIDGKEKLDYARDLPVEVRWPIGKILIMKMTSLRVWMSLVSASHRSAFLLNCARQFLSM